MLVTGFSYVAVCLLFSSLFLFRIIRIRRRRKVHVRYLICDEFLVSERELIFTFAIYMSSIRLSVCRL